VAKVKRMIAFDKTEIVLGVTGGRQLQVLNLTYDKIVSIAFDKAKMKLPFFRTKESDAIIITVRGREFPVMYYREKEKQLFDEYLAGMETFAKDNRITFYNKLA
jgi:hypothetical protein